MSLRLLSVNLQAGARTDAWVHYFSRLHHQFSFADRGRTITEIAQALADFDLIAIQESDEGSPRTGGLHLTRELAERAGFGYWTHGTNRRLMHATTGNAILSRFPIEDAEVFGLPGSRGRGALEARLRTPGGTLTLVSVHLSLRARVRRLQADALCERHAGAPTTLICGDFNATETSAELTPLASGFSLGPSPLRTYPRWSPRRRIDHIFHSSDLALEGVALTAPVPGDHLPVGVHVRWPAA